MGDITDELRANASYWAKNNGIGTARMLDAAATEIAVLRRRVAELEDHASWQADQHIERSRREDDLRHLLAELLDRIHPTWEQALPPYDPLRAAAKHARRRPEDTDRG